MGTQLVIFDCDGVLVDSEKLVVEVEVDLLTDAGFALTAAEIIERYVGLSYPTMMRDLAADFGRPVPEGLSEQVQQAALERLAVDLEAVAGIDRVLGALDGPRCVASSSDLDRIELSLRVSRLTQYFDPATIFSAQMVDRPKPAPDLFELAARKMDTPVECCVVVEDSPHGVVGAVAAGMTAVGLVAGGHAGPALGERLAGAGAVEVFETAADLGDYLLSVT